MKTVIAIIAAITLTALAAAGQTFRFPVIPQEIRTPEARATWLTLHFWDHFDFTADPQLDSAAVTEQAFVDFISLLPMSTDRGKAMDSFIRKAAGNEKMFIRLMELADKYLYEPASPVHDDGMYMELLEKAARKAPKSERKRLRWQMEKLKMNAVGKRAQDFEYMDGTTKKTLRRTEGEYILVFFHDPYCRDCRRMKNELDASEAIRSMTENGRMKIIAVSIEDEDNLLYYSGLYDLRTFPALYLLDAKKRVLLKNASVAEVENLL